MPVVLSPRIFLDDPPALIELAGEERTGPKGRVHAQDLTRNDLGFGYASGPVIAGMDHDARKRSADQLGGILHLDEADLAALNEFLRRLDRSDLPLGPHGHGEQARRVGCQDVTRLDEIDHVSLEGRDVDCRLAQRRSQ